MEYGGGQLGSIVRNVIIIIAAIYILVALAMFIFQSRFIYFPTKEISTTPVEIGLSYEDISFATADSLTLSGWFIPSKRNRRTILFCHGNAGNISHRLDSIKLLNELGMNIFIFDYRGYGKSDGGIPDEKGSYRDAEAAWEYLTTVRNIDPRNIIIFGRSLGGAVAAELALKKPAAALVIESSFTSIKDLGAKLYPFLPVRLLSKYEYNTLEKVKAIESPKLIIHSRNDELVPYEYGRRIFKAAREPKQFLELSGGHNDGFLMSRDVYKTALDSFFNVYELKGRRD